MDVTGLAVGEYDLPLVCEVETETEAEWFALPDPVTVHVTITGRKN